jgi:hypothetical protein
MLPGLTEEDAQKILEYRSQGGSFVCVEDLVLYLDLPHTTIGPLRIRRSSTWAHPDSPESSSNGHPSAEPVFPSQRREYAWRREQVRGVILCALDPPTPERWRGVNRSTYSDEQLFNFVQL